MNTLKRIWTATKAAASAAAKEFAKVYGGEAETQGGGGPNPTTPK